MSDIEWRDIEGYEGLYQVSDSGLVRRVRPLRGVPNTLIVPGKNTKGYIHVTLSKNDKKTTYDIHRLVAKAFLGEPTDANPHVNHKDGDKTNNRLSNLEWTDYYKNMEHADKVLGAFPFRGEAHPMAKINQADADKIRELAKNGIPTRDIAKRYSLGASYVSGIISGRCWKSHETST